MTVGVQAGVARGRAGAPTGDDGPIAVNLHADIAHAVIIARAVARFIGGFVGARPDTDALIERNSPGQVNLAAADGGDIHVIP